MSAWDHYLYSILVCALSCGMVMQLVSQTKAKALIRFACAMLMTISLGTPLAGMNWSDALRFPQLQGSGADAYVREGTETALDARSACIREVTETYILEKAKLLGAEILEVTITLNEDLLPAFAEINGRMNQAAQEKLQEILMTDLGIPKEQQIWTWNQESSSSSS